MSVSSSETLSHATASFPVHNIWLAGTPVLAVFIEKLRMAA